MAKAPIINPQSGMAPWPDDWPLRFNTNEPCDMAIGPCACGAWHMQGDWEVVDGELLSNGVVVPSVPRTKQGPTHAQNP